MNSGVVALITFGCVFGGALTGIWLQRRLKQGHLSEQSKTTVNYVTGLLTTLSALVLGLLISSSKGTFDTVSGRLKEVAAKTMLVDRLLSEFGPEAKDAREAVRNVYTKNLKAIAAKEKKQDETDAALRGSSSASEVELKILALPSTSEHQRSLQSRALQLNYELRLARWTILEETDTTIPPVFLGVLISWLTVMFLGFGIYSPRNRLTLIALFVGALAMAGSVFLVEEMSHPLSGIISVSRTPLLKVLDVLGK